ncbi:coniferyl aldehyde dehydrogenase [Vibrio palustris]|uniref:Aldehyde dehydrogenase n=1 Tax=Vibrio palustris TaxID=1918946 RepID=A0A1R4B597_9VIBR|nr:coniferyl aldehyde dehydrogenase [Vibrio palustris]SJL84079.1 Coniferyl aldehyde dehydrogenase [Vibrio palustris]
MSELHSMLRTMKTAHIDAGPADISTRKQRLKKSIALLKDNYTALCGAMSDDFGHRSHYQSVLADIMSAIGALKHSHDHLDEWIKPEHVDDIDGGIQAWIQQQPVGVVGVISPWNFPLNLAFGPLASIFAAGNRAMLKPSELTPRTSALLKELVAQYFDPQELTVVTGGADVGKAFSALPFDHLVFTGSGAVGKHIMRAAAENLVPVTLELGGKSPVVVDSDYDITIAAARTLTVKTFNTGQICMSPDYIMIPEGSESAFQAASAEFIEQSFPSMIDNEDYTTIITDRHFARLVAMLDDARDKGANVVSLAPQGEPDYDTKTRKMAIHLIFGVTEEMDVMQEEIFGPLFPVKTYTQLDDTIEYINAHDRPLAAYLFSDNSANQDKFAQHTTSGALVINDVMTHASLNDLPFGGVGGSGIGAYHGLHGFREFTHAKPVVVQTPQGESGLRLRAPYSQETLEAMTSFLDA